MQAGEQNIKIESDFFGRKQRRSRSNKRKNVLQKIYIEAQSDAIGYYEREGFKVTSNEFLEDGIPHVQMELILK